MVGIGGRKKCSKLHVCEHINDVHVSGDFQGMLSMAQRGLTCLTFPLREAFFDVIIHKV